jgi:hypothetical protein
MATGFKQATVTAVKVPSTQTNFPAYVDLSRLGITTQVEADSVRVYSDSGKTTELAREIVSVSEMHVKIPSLTSTTTIYVDWDGSRSDYAVTDTYGRNAVWSDYEWVSHMFDATTSTVTDATGGGLTGTKTSANNPLEETGQIGKGQTVSSDRIDTSSVPMTATDNWTIQAWLKPNSTGNFYAIIHNGANANGYALAMNASKWALLMASKSWNQSSTSVTTGSWAHVVGIRNSGTISMYINGNADSVLYDNIGPNTPTTLLRMGVATFNTAYAGGIDEVRLRASVLSADWITTEYNNQSDESTFWGTWSDVGSGGGTIQPQNPLFIGGGI